MVDKARICIVGFVSYKTCFFGCGWSSTFGLSLRPHNHHGSIGLEISERIFTTEKFMLERGAVCTVCGVSWLEFHKSPCPLEFMRP